MVAKGKYLRCLIALAGILVSSGLFPSASGIAQQPPTPTPYYIPSQILATYSVDIPACYGKVYYPQEGWLPCNAPSGTPVQTLEAIWPDTIRTYEFSLPAETWLALEIHRVMDDIYPGTLGVVVQQLDAAGKWNSLNVPSTGTTTKKGILEGPPFDPQWASKVPYNSGWAAWPAGQYRIFAWGQDVYFDGALYGYWPSKGTITVYAFDNSPLPTETPAPTNKPAPTETPTATLRPGETPVSGDLSIENAVILLQAVQGGKLISGRDVALVVKPYWVGPPPYGPTEIGCQLSITVDGLFTAQKTDRVGPAIEFVLPASLFPEGNTTEHTISLHAETVGAPVDDLNLLNDRIDLSFTTYASRPMRLLFTRVWPGGASVIGISELNKFAGEAVQYLQQVYPVPRVARVGGSYLVLPGTSSKISVSVAVAKTLTQFNNNRCREALPNGDTRPIVPCNAPRADMAVGVFPDHTFGSSTEGWLYGRGSKTWLKWMDWTSEGFGWISGGRAELDRAAITSAENFINTAHEIGHHFDRNDEYDDNLGILIQSTLIWQNGKIFDPQAVTGKAQREYYNFMGNAGLGYPATQYWVNADTWNAILDRLTQQGRVAHPVEVASLNDIPKTQEVAPTEMDGPALLVMGYLDAQGNAVIQTVDRLSHFDIPSSAAGEYRLEALDNLGNSAGMVEFNTYPLDIDQQVPFLVTIPLEGPGNVFNLVHEVRLSRAGVSLASLGRSPNSPEITLPVVPDLSAATISLSWSAQDADGDALRSSVYYTGDGGQTWQVLAQDLTASQIEIEPALLPGGNAQFRVVVSDGLNEASVASNPIAAPNRPPEVAVYLPWGTAFTETQPVILSAYGYDPEEGDLPDTALVWSDESGQQVGQGRLLKAYLAPGAHTLTVTGRDAQGQSASASGMVTVEKETPPVVSQPNSAIWIYLAGGAIALVGLAGAGWSVFLALRPVESSLAAVQNEGRVWQQRFQAGQLQPNMLAQVQQRLQARDRRGNLWSFDPTRGQWLRWDGRFWRSSAPPQNLNRLGRIGCGVLMLAVSVAAIILAVMIVWFQG